MGLTAGEELASEGQSSGWGGEWTLVLADLLLRHLNFGTSVTA